MKRMNATKMIQKSHQKRKSPTKSRRDASLKCSNQMRTCSSSSFVREHNMTCKIPPLPTTIATTHYPSFHVFLSWILATSSSYSICFTFKNRRRPTDGTCLLSRKQSSILHLSKRSSKEIKQLVV